MDLSQTLRYKVLVERKRYTLFVEFEYENLPEFCSNCNFIGHNIENFKKLKSHEEDNEDRK
jgi:hypothetical protein